MLYAVPWWTQQTHEAMLISCCISVADRGPTLNQRGSKSGVVSPLIGRRCCWSHGAHTSHPPLPGLYLMTPTLRGMLLLFQGKVCAAISGLPTTLMDSPAKCWHAITACRRSGTDSSPPIGGCSPIRELLSGSQFASYFWRTGATALIADNVSRRPDHFQKVNSTHLGYVYTRMQSGRYLSSLWRILISAWVYNYFLPLICHMVLWIFPSQMVCA